MSNLKVVKLNNQVQQYSTGVYVEAAFEGDSAYEEELFELTDSSYEKYMNFRANPCKDKDVLVKLMAKDGRKIALFHNSPYKHHLPAHKACVLDQADVKAEDGKQTVSAYVAEVAKAEGIKLSLKSFVRFETGEGLEKKEENFAEEVAKQMGK